MLAQSSLLDHPDQPLIASLAYYAESRIMLS